jgi:outer membrane protein assembly factor BamB
MAFLPVAMGEAHSTQGELESKSANSASEIDGGAAFEMDSRAEQIVRVYVGSRDNNVYCIDALTGAKIWKYPTGNWVDSSPAVVVLQISPQASFTVTPSSGTTDTTFTFDASPLLMIPMAP